MKLFKTRRWWIVFCLPLVVILINSFGPDGWREPAARLLWLSWAFVALTAAHIARKALHDYADGETAFNKAITGSTGAGLAFLGICLLGGMLFLGLISLAQAQDVRSYIPLKAKPLLPVLREVQQETWPEMPFPSYFGGLIEHESCITLRHSRCWDPKARLKTAREEGGSLGQFTRAWTASGRLRFDAVDEVRRLDPEGLREFSWETIYDRPELSLRAILVKTKDCHSRLTRRALDVTPYNATALCDAAYNGGYGGMQSDRTLCHMVDGCNADVWFGHVELHSKKSRTKWQGYGKSAFEINRHHVRDVMLVRRHKYAPFLGADSA